MIPRPKGPVQGQHEEPSGNPGRVSLLWMLRAVISPPPGRQSGTLSYPSFWLAKDRLEKASKVAKGPLAQDVVTLSPGFESGLSCVNLDKFPNLSGSQSPHP